MTIKRSAHPPRLRPRPPRLPRFVISSTRVHCSSRALAFAKRLDCGRFSAAFARTTRLQTAISLHPRQSGAQAHALQTLPRSSCPCNSQYSFRVFRPLSPSSSSSSSSSLAAPTCRAKAKRRRKRSVCGSSIFVLTLCLCASVVHPFEFSALSAVK